MSFGLRVARFYIKAHEVPEILSSSRVPNIVPAPVLVHQRPCLSQSSSASGLWRLGWRDRQGVCFVFCVAVVGKGSACDSVVCVCLASASLNKQWLGWAMPRVCNGAWAGAKVRAKGKGTRTLHHHHQPGRGSCGWKAPRKRRRGMAGAKGVPRPTPAQLLLPMAALAHYLSSRERLSL